MTRPPHPTWGPADGYEWVARPDEEWCLATPDEADVRKCRHSTAHPCPNKPVAAMNRGVRINEPPYVADRLWFYCADHMYGRWIEDGEVMGWTTRKVVA